MAMYRKKPVVVEAFQIGRVGEIAPPEAAVLVNTGVFRFLGSNKYEIDTLEGTMTASPGDWIIKGVNGEFYPCKPDIFAKTYEPA